MLAVFDVIIATDEFPLKSYTAIKVKFTESIFSIITVFSILDEQC